jgi:hypothetical protein
MIDLWIVRDKQQQAVGEYVQKNQNIIRSTRTVNSLLYSPISFLFTYIKYIRVGFALTTGFILKCNSSFYEYNPHVLIRLMKEKSYSNMSVVDV